MDAFTDIELGRKGRQEKHTPCGFCPVWLCVRQDMVGEVMVGTGTGQGSTEPFGAGNVPGLGQGSVGTDAHRFEGSSNCPQDLCPCLLLATLKWKWTDSWGSTTHT